MSESQKPNYLSGLNNSSINDMAKRKIIERKNDEGSVVYRLNPNTKKGRYYILDSSDQKEFILSPIKVDGFDSWPSGFYIKDGYGLTLAGKLLLDEIRNKYNKPIDLTITSAPKSKIDARGKNVTAVISHTLLKNLGQTIRSVKQARNQEMRLETQHAIGASISQFRDLKDTEATYAGGQLAQLLQSPKVMNNLNDEDRSILEQFIPEYFSTITGTLRAKRKLKVVFDSLDAGKTIYLQKALAEFRKKLDKDVKDESSWQRFLSEYILVLRQNYGEVLEKTSVSLPGKFPDFLLIDPYGYLDIYEIKKPSTNLLRYDNSRNNYYWDADLSKAIAQTENYIYQVQRNADTLTIDLKKNKGIEVNIVRPRGFIIAGKRSQLSSTKMQDDFRILSDSLKNIDIILYDDLLEGLESLLERSSE